MNNSIKNINRISAILIIAIVSTIYISKSILTDDNINTSESLTDHNNNNQSLNLMTNMPLRFIPNKGQAGTEAKYHVQGVGHTVLFQEEKIVLRREKSADKRNEIVLEFEGANKSPIIEGREKLSGVANFYKGSNPTKWQTNLPTYSSIIYKELYPGIDMGYIGEMGKLESEFYVSPNTDYHKIKLNYSGVKSKRIRDDGALVFETELGELIENTPYVFQEIDNQKISVDAQYAILEDKSIGFELGSYNSDYPVVIDPELIFITVVQAVTDIWGSGVVIDDNGDLIVAGAANRFFPATDTIQGSNHDGGLGNDGLLLKLDGTSGDVIYSAIFGGASGDYFNDIAINANGNIFLTGFTESLDFPIMNAAQETLGGGDDATLTILNSSLELITSTYLGGTGYDYGEGISVDEAGNAYIGGTTNSLDFPTMGGYQSQLNGLPDGFGEYASDLFITKYNSNGSISYSTYLGGTSIDRLADIEVNANGEATISGTSESEDFPLANAYQNSFGGGAAFEGDIVISRLNSSGNGLIYSTYFGDAAADWATGISLGADGSAIVAGNTTSLDFPIINGESMGITDESDGVLVMLDNSGQPLYSVRTNIPGWDEFVALAADDSSTAFPVASENSIKVFEKALDDTLSLAFENEAMGHNINGVYLADANLAFAATYWGATTNGLNNIARQEKNSTISNALLSGAECSAGKILLDEYYIFIVNGCLEIIAKPNTEVNFKLGVSDDGFVTLIHYKDGTATTHIKADEVFCINIKGNKKDGNVDLMDVTRANFRFIPETGRPINVDFSEANGHAVFYGSPHYGNVFIGGLNYNTALGGKKSDLVDVRNGGNNLINSGGGDDEIIISKRSNNGIRPSEGNDKIGFVYSDKVFWPQPNHLHKSDIITVLSDSLGIDTLDFTGIIDTLNFTGINIDLALLEREQTIDSAGTQVILEGNFEVLFGSEYNDEITVSPLPDTARHIDGRDGSDILNFNAEVLGSVDDGSTIATPGYADVTYTNFETVNISVATNLETFESELPITFSLSNNYPNPFNPTTKINYSIPEQSDVSLKVFDVLGREVVSLVEGEQPQGNYKVEFDASNLTSGIYFYRIQAGQFIESKKMVLIK